MKIIVTSDTHGYLPKVEGFDLFLIGGDVCPAHDHYYSFQEKWVETEFVDWINSLPYKNENSKVVLVPGNHDFFFERANRSTLKKLEKSTNERLKILRHNEYEFEYPVSDGLDSLKIFGTPYCSSFGRWAFMLLEDKLDEKFSKIPEGIDILLSHDSPTINLLGAIMEGPRFDLSTGNTVLAKHVKRVKPKMFFSGHFHSGNHDFDDVDGIYMANVSFVNEMYVPYGKVLSIDYDEENRQITSWAYPEVKFF